MWDPATYLLFAAERTRPARDLLAAVDVADPVRVVDLGCGTGTSTALLADRWREAEIVGVDASADMIAAATSPAGRSTAAKGGRVTFEVADVARWRPPRPVDVIFSNALFQWVPDHLDVLDDLLAYVVPGGRLAFSVPGNMDAPTHALLREVCGSPRWQARLGQFAGGRRGAFDPREYLDRLAGDGRHVDVWETTYLHVLAGEDPVLDWVSGTALRPVLAALDPAAHDEFRADYGARLRVAYPPGPAGTVLPFRRIFVVVGIT